MRKRVRLYTFTKGGSWAYIATERGVTRKRAFPTITCSEIGGTIPLTMSRSDTAIAIWNRRRQGFTSAPILHLGNI